MKPKLPKTKKRRCGFACMTVEQRTKIARKGGESIAKRRGHMAKIGRVGGTRKIKPVTKKGSI